LDPALDGRDRVAPDGQSSARRLSGKSALHSRQRQSRIPAQRRARGVLTLDRRTAALPQAVQAHWRARTAAQSRCHVRCDDTGRPGQAVVIVPYPSVSLSDPPPAA
jgi:hypothetical protein